METSVASAIEDLPVDDVAREDPSSGAFEVSWSLARGSVGLTPKENMSAKVQRWR